MKIYKVTIDKDELKSLPQEEVLFFIQAGSALNDINILNKLLIVSNKKVDNPIETKAQNSQTLFVLSILTGKLWECWIFLRKAYFQTKLSESYEQLLSNEAKECLSKLKSCFGRGTLIKNIRNKLAFHYDMGEIRDSVNQMLDDNIPEFYMSEFQGNNLFYISEFIRLKIILEYTGKSNASEAFDTLFTEVLNTTKLLMQFLHHCLIVAARNYTNLKIENTDINDPPSITNVFLPYFVGRPIDDKD